MCGFKILWVNLWNFTQILKTMHRKMCILLTFNFVCVCEIFVLWRQKPEWHWSSVMNDLDKKLLTPKSLSLSVLTLVGQIPVHQWMSIMTAVTSIDMWACGTIDLCLYCRLKWFVSIFYDGKRTVGTLFEYATRYKYSINSPLVEYWNNLYGGIRGMVSLY